MGYAHYIDKDGNPSGYTVDTTCAQQGCVAQIDRGLGYMCGPPPDDEGCQRFFCGEHGGGSMCAECRKEFDAAEIINEIVEAMGKKLDQADIAGEVVESVQVHVEYDPGTCTLHLSDGSVYGVTIHEIRGAR